MAGIHHPVYGTVCLYYILAHVEGDQRDRKVKTNGLWPRPHSHSCTKRRGSCSSWHATALIAQ